MMKEKRTAFRTIEGSARSVLLEGGAIRGCEKHGWMKHWADPHARERALLVAREDPPPGASPKAAVAASDEVFGSIGDTCPNATWMEKSPDGGLDIALLLTRRADGGVRPELHHRNAVRARHGP
jgi:hypothetical protein